MKTPIRICLIEDDDRLRHLFARWLQNEPDFVVVNQYSDAETAIEKMPHDQPDVALVDINLTGQNGIECVRQLKPLLSRTQFGMVTVYEDADKIFEALAAGATGYILKQTPKVEWIAAIRELHSGGSPMSPNIARKVVQSFQINAAPKAITTERLSEREGQVLDGLVRGDLYKEISDNLGISMGTLHTYIRRIYEKLHVHSRAQAVAKVTKRRD
ncbi:MAG: response regulator transcription factor [Akkermansiaceae bacterium]